MLGTPMTIRLPPWPPDANIRYSSFLPLGVYVFSAATASASLRFRAFRSSARLLPPAALPALSVGGSLHDPRTSGVAARPRSIARSVVFRMSVSLPCRRGIALLGTDLARRSKSAFSAHQIAALASVSRVRWKRLTFSDLGLLSLDGAQIRSIVGAYYSYLAV